MVLRSIHTGILLTTARTSIEKEAEEENEKERERRKNDSNRGRSSVFFAVEKIGNS